MTKRGSPCKYPNETPEQHKERLRGYQEKPWYTVNSVISTLKWDTIRWMLSSSRATFWTPETRLPFQSRATAIICVPDNVWSEVRGKRSFRSYDYNKLKLELDVLLESPPWATTYKFIKWTRQCHPTISIHAYNARYKKFIAHRAEHAWDIFSVPIER